MSLKNGIFTRSTVLLVFCGFLLSVSASCAQSPPTLPDIDIGRSPNGIVSLPGTVDPVFTVFDRYTKIVAPNGKPIHILAEKGYTDEQIVHARSVLRNHLTNVPGSLYGSDKSAIANALADNDAVLTLFYSTESMRSEAARRFFDGGVNSQDLRAYETIREGTAGYMDQDNPIRDASYEEILHLIQDYGINYAAPELSDKLWEAYRNALDRGIYTLKDTETNEYFICGLEAYFDLWKHDPAGDGTREGEYMPISRETLKEKDPAMYEIIEEFFGKTWQYTAGIDSGFAGTFSLTYDENLTYTNKSQHLKNARLTGSRNAHLTGNDYDNKLTGNNGDNVITPRKGFDLVDGGKGSDTAVFPGSYHDYQVGRQYGYVVVVSEPEGENRLTNIEKIQFDDRTLNSAAVRDVPPLPDIDISASENGVVPLPDYVDSAFRIFTKYTKVIAPNGKPIHIVAQSGVSDRQIVYARDVLTSHLTNVDGSLYGRDKSVIANTMADRNAVLSLSARGSAVSEAARTAFRESGIVSQGLGAHEIIIEGTDDYMSDTPRRDASYEEILHFVHDQGIIPSYSPMQAALYRALDKALESGKYRPDEGLPRGSFTQEYLVMGMEAYFGLWQHDPGGDGWASGGEYAYISRDSFREGDPDLYAIVDGFLPRHWAYTAKIADEFEGTFSLTYDKNKIYTYKSRYLKDAALQGTNDSNLTGNGFDNVLAGNRGDNELTGGAGDDELDGGDCVDTAVFSGDFREYGMEKRGGIVTVSDTVERRDGRDTLTNIEKIRFRDRTVSVSEL